MKDDFYGFAYSGFNDRCGYFIRDGICPTLETERLKEIVAYNKMLGKKEVYITDVQHTYVQFLRTND